MLRIEPAPNGENLAWVFLCAGEIVVSFSGKGRPANCLWSSVTPLPLIEKRSGR